MTLRAVPVSEFVGARWHVAQLKGGEEKGFARRMIELDIGYFLPMELIKRRDEKNRHWRRIWRALFPGYAFFYGGDVERYDVLESGATVGRKVISVLSCALQDKLATQLSELHIALLSNPIIAKPLAADSRVRVTSGPFENKEGTVDFEGKATVTLRVDVLGASTTFEIDRQLVEVID